MLLQRNVPEAPSNVRAMAKAGEGRELKPRAGGVKCHGCGQVGDHNTSSCPKKTTKALVENERVTKQILKLPNLSGEEWDVLAGKAATQGATAPPAMSDRESNVLRIRFSGHQMRERINALEKMVLNCLGDHNGAEADDDDDGGDSVEEDDEEEEGVGQVGEEDDGSDVGSMEEEEADGKEGHVTSPAKKNRRQDQSFPRQSVMGMFHSGVNPQNR
jgi:hypothetical protein